MTASLFPENLRAEYDTQLLDVAQRQSKATAVRRALLDARLWNAPQWILDVGCGSGLLLNALVSSNVVKVGCDIRVEPFAMAMRMHRINIQFVQADAEALPFRANRFDLVICLAVIEEWRDWRVTLQQLAGCVSPGGLLYVTVTNGVGLERIYSLAKIMRLKIADSKQLYAKNSLPFFEMPASAGWGIAPIRDWRYVSITPFLARAQFPVLRLIPLWLLEWLLQWVAPSFAYAWQRPCEDQA